MLHPLREGSLSLLSLATILTLTIPFRPVPVYQNAKASSAQSGKAPAVAKITAAAKWDPSSSFMASAGAACDSKWRDLIGWCYIDQMAQAGAPAAAVEFSRRLAYQYGGEFCVMLDFDKLHPVDMAKVFCPLSAHFAHILLLVNGDPEILDVDDLTKLDIRGMEQDKAYQAIKHNTPALKLWPGARWGTAWDPVQKHTDGGQSFDMYYILDTHPLNGTLWISGVHFDWNFDAKGKFLGTKFGGGVGQLPD
jgi:hypothetical protein